MFNWKRLPIRKALIVSMLTPGEESGSDRNHNQQNANTKLFRNLHLIKQDNVRDDPIAAKKQNIKTDDKCDLGPSLCYLAIVRVIVGFASSWS